MVSEERVKGLERQLMEFQVSFAGFKAELDKHRIDLPDNIAVKFTSAKLELDGICNDIKQEFVRV